VIRNTPNVMKLGLSSYTYPWACGVPGSAPGRPLTGLDLGRLAVAHGVRVLQLCENVALPREEIDELARLGLEIEIGTRGLRDAHLGKAWRLAERFGSRLVRLVIDRDGHKPSPDEALALLRPWAERAAATGIALAIENHDRFGAATMARMCEALGSEQVGITLDTVNSFGALEGPAAVVATLAPHVLSLHVKDFIIRRVPSQMGFVIEGCPAGDGRLDIPWVISEMRAAGRDPNAIVELWTSPAETIQETMAREAEWAERSIGFLRTLIPD
jgi:3-oxoisoapionate decarboxylase